MVQNEQDPHLASLAALRFRMDSRRDHDQDSWGWHQLSSQWQMIGNALISQTLARNSAKSRGPRAKGKS
jgi:hypothetical protein